MRIEVYKEKKELKLIDDENIVIIEAQIGIGKGPLGHKNLEGDCITPEGEYEIVVKNPKSAHYLSLGLNYPNKKDAALGFEHGSITKQEFDEITRRLDANEGTLWNTALGGKVYIHGGLEEYETTHGCVSMYKKELEELYSKAHIGLRVIIYP